MYLCNEYLLISVTIRTELFCIDEKNLQEKLLFILIFSCLIILNEIFVSTSRIPFEHTFFLLLPTTILLFIT